MTSQNLLAENDENRMVGNKRRGFSSWKGSGSAWLGAYKRVG